MSFIHFFSPMNIIQLLNSLDLIFLPHEGALYAINYISAELICTDFACICGYEVGFKHYECFYFVLL